VMSDVSNIQFLPRIASNQDHFGREKTYLNSVDEVKVDSSKISYERCVRKIGFDHIAVNYKQILTRVDNLELSRRVEDGSIGN
jgi:hypothetical protein